MKNQILTSLISFGFAALLGSVPAAAQPSQWTTIPFAFEAGGVEYPEGNYTLREIGGATRVIAITSRTTGRGAMISLPVLSDKKEHSNTKLVFTHTGDQYRLREVWFAGRPGMMTTSSENAKELSARVTIQVK